MWSAIKSDLFEFVATVQEEAQETLSKVVDLERRSEEEELKISEDERVLSDFRNNFGTYSEDVDDEQLPEFEKFLKGFSLSSKAEEIEYILEEESGVTKHYDALVPAHLTPEMFWARYFFKVNILIITSLDSVLESAYDDEEELTWGEDDDCDQHVDDNTKIPSLSSTSSQSPINCDAGSVNSLCRESTEGKSQKEASVADDVALIAASKISKLQEINDSLTTRASMLESEVEKLQNQLIKERTVSAKLRSGLAQSEDRERCLMEEVHDLQQKLLSSEQSLKDSINDLPSHPVGSHSAPTSNGSSIVDLGTSHHHENDISSSTESKPIPQTEMAPSVSDISLASLQSVSSTSSTTDSKSSCNLKVVETPNTSSLGSVEESLEKGSAKKGDVTVLSSGSARQDIEVDEDEEEWDNEAWE